MEYGEHNHYYDPMCMVPIIQLKFWPPFVGEIKSTVSGVQRYAPSSGEFSIGNRAC